MVFLTAFRLGAIARRN